MNLKSLYILAKAFLSKRDVFDTITADIAKVSVRLQAHIDALIAAKNKNNDRTVDLMDAYVDAKEALTERYEDDLEILEDAYSNLCDDLAKAARVKGKFDALVA